MILAEIILTKEKSIKKMSLVSKPAVGVDYLKLAEERQLKMAINEDKQNITGPCLIPNKNYYRNAEYFKNEDGGYIYFSIETVRQIAIDFLKNADNSVSLNHDENISNDDAELVESWIIETPEDKAYDLGFSKEDCPIGTWMLTEHINSDSIWKEIKAGNLNGYSIEGKFSTRIVSENVSLGKQLSEDEIIEAITNVVKNYKE